MTHEKPTRPRGRVKRRVRPALLPGGPGPGSIPTGLRGTGPSSPTRDPRQHPTLLLYEPCASMASVVKTKSQTATPLLFLSLSLALLAHSLTVAAVPYRGHAPALVPPGGRPSANSAIWRSRADLD